MRVKLNPTPARLVEIAASVRARQVDRSKVCLAKCEEALKWLKTTDAARMAAINRMETPAAIVAIMELETAYAGTYSALQWHADMITFGGEMPPELR